MEPQRTIARPGPRRRRRPAGAAAAPLVALIATACAGGTRAPRSSSLPPDVLRQVLAGAASLQLPGDEASVPLVGTPTLPLVTVRLNDRATARFLVDLGSNVVIVRRDVFARARGTVLVDRDTHDIGRFDTLALGGAVYRGVAVGIYEELDVDGVVGYNLLRHSAFTIDFPGQRLRLHHGRLAPTDPGVARFTDDDGMPMVGARVGDAALTVNLDTGARECMTIPPALVDRVAWTAPPAPGPVLTNNQTGAVQVLAGHAAGAAVLGPLRIERPLVYVNRDADHAWLGAACMNGAAWTFDPERRLVRVALAGGPAGG
jgi:hypothetical protein